MRERHYLALDADGFRRVAYTEWGATDCERTVVCVHGLTRNGRDFDTLAATLARENRVVCPDVVGRGRSDWLVDKSRYDYPTYLADMATLLARLDVEAVDWVGTSMGGLIGLFLAIQPNSPIRRLVLNDIGAQVPLAALQRISSYVGLDRSFASYEEARAYLREIQSGWGDLDAGQWDHLARHGTRRDGDGNWRLAHDPGIASAFSEPKEVELWPFWEAVRCPVLLMHGADSDVLLPETVARMRAGGPPLTVSGWPGVGHAPSLMEARQVATVADWLAAT